MIKRRPGESVDEWIERDIRMWRNLAIGAVILFVIVAIVAARIAGNALDELGEKLDKQSQQDK